MYKTLKMLSKNSRTNHIIEKNKVNCINFFGRTLKKLKASTYRLPKFEGFFHYSSPLLKVFTFLIIFDTTRYILQALFKKDVVSSGGL